MADESDGNYSTSIPTDSNKKRTYSAQAETQSPPKRQKTSQGALGEDDDLDVEEEVDNIEPTWPVVERPIMESANPQAITALANYFTAPMMFNMHQNVIEDERVYSGAPDAGQGITQVPTINNVGEHGGQNGSLANFGASRSSITAATVPGHQDANGVDFGAAGFDAVDVDAVNFGAPNLNTGHTNGQGFSDGTTPGSRSGSSAKNFRGASVESTTTPGNQSDGSYNFDAGLIIPGESRVYAVGVPNAAGQADLSPMPMPMMPAPGRRMPGSNGSCDDVRAGWASFKEARNLTDTWKNRKPQSEREKYAPYLQQQLVGRNNQAVDLFVASLQAGLWALVVPQTPRTCPEETILDGTFEMAAAIRTDRVARDGQSVLPACSNKVFDDKVRNRVVNLVNRQLQEPKFNPVEYPKARQLKGKPRHGCVSGSFSIAKGADVGLHGGHRGGDFIFTYKGTQGIEVHDRQRFNYMGQVPRTRGEYVYRLNSILGRASDLTIWALKFKAYWSSQSQEIEPQTLGISDTGNAVGVWSAYRQHKERLGASAGRASPLGRMVQDVLYEKDEICEFGWLMMQLRKLKWAVSENIAAVEEMLNDMAGPTKGLATEYEGRQRDIAWDLLLNRGESGDRVLVCMNNIHKNLFPDTPVTDPLLNIWKPIDLRAQLHEALVSIEEEVAAGYRDHLNEGARDVLRTVEAQGLPPGVELDAVIQSLNARGPLLNGRLNVAVQNPLVEAQLQNPTLLPDFDPSTLAAPPNDPPSPGIRNVEIRAPNPEDAQEQPELNQRARPQIPHVIQQLAAADYDFDKFT